MNTQSIAKILGESGCYFISLLKIVNLNDDAIKLYRQSVELGIIDADCYVKDPAQLLCLITDWRHWEVRHESASYQTKPFEYEILRFERKTPTRTYSHFVVGDGHGNVLYDPLDDSNTVKFGQIVSKRIVRKV